MTGKRRRSGRSLPAESIAAFQESLLGWYARHRRDLPWRRTPTPYRIWVSEIMLQQTRVRTVLPYYERFLKRFPDVKSLARASESEVLELWAGLGYYSRARNLLRAAVRIVNDHRGRFPGTMEELRSLPGIGRYTAGAILSIAFNKPMPIVDGNVRRLICRLLGITGRRDEEFFWHQATAWILTGRASDFNQAVMELGALVCLPSRPLCMECPVRNLCMTGKRGNAGRIPLPRPKRESQSVLFTLLLLECRERLLLSKTHGADFIPGEWGLPATAVGTADAARPAAARLAQAALRRRVSLAEAGTLSHAITYRSIRVHVFHAALGGDARLPVPRSGYRWVGRAEAARLLTSSLYRKALRLKWPVRRSAGHRENPQLP
jgi:A/G-specific adenine glycosylase